MNKMRQELLVSILFVGVMTVLYVLGDCGVDTLSLIVSIAMALIALAVRYLTVMKGEEKG